MSTQRRLVPPTEPGVGGRKVLLDGGLNALLDGVYCLLGEWGECFVEDGVTGKGRAGGGVNSVKEVARGTRRTAWGGVVAAGFAVPAAAAARAACNRSNRLGETQSAAFGVETILGAVGLRVMTVVALVGLHGGCTTVCLCTTGCLCTPNRCSANRCCSTYQGDGLPCFQRIKRK